MARYLCIIIFEADVQFSNLQNTDDNSCKCAVLRVIQKTGKNKRQRKLVRNKRQRKLVRINVRENW